MGVWVGDRKIIAPPGQDITIAKTLSEFRLELKPDGRFTLLDSGIPKEGVFRSSNGKVYLQVDTIMNRPLSSSEEHVRKSHVETELKPIDDQTMEYIDPQGFDASPLILKRESQPGG